MYLSPNLEKIFQEKIIAVNNIISTFFGKNFLISLKNESYSGYAFSDFKRFVFDKNHENFLQSKPKIIVRFLCDLKLIAKSYELNAFLKKINHYNKTSLFLMIPYYFENLNQQGEELVAYRPKCEFQITFNLETKKIKLNAKKYLRLKDFKNIKAKIKNVLELAPEVKPRKPQAFGSSGKVKFLNNREILKSKLCIIDAIQNVIQHMTRGDCYLANITRTYQIKNKSKIFNSNYYLHKWFEQKSLFGFFLLQNDIHLACFSPERFLIKHNNKIATQPIKGTAPLKTQTLLWENQKEMCEHTMVIDLLRHDLNAICKPGSVQVQKPFFLKKCESILQMQSSIIGSLKSKMSFTKIIKTMLPAGSITGTPKKRTCELIAQYETELRGYYTGIAGIIEKNKKFDFTVLIRSYFKGKLGSYVGTGAGITTLSSAEDEFKEFCLKLRTFV